MGGGYDCAFLVLGYAYDTPIETQRFTATDSLEGTTRSRYLTVCHEHAVRYMLQHPDKKIIMTGTGCAIQGLLNTIEMHHLHRENYLLIGLFCEKTMNYNVIRYFAEHDCGNGRKIKEFYFKHKEAGGWPGNVRIVYEDGPVCDLPNTERIKVKDYFSCERCLYCLDKLNRNADISVGDNYIKKNADIEGVSSVIIRTKIGERVWMICRDGFDYSNDDKNELLESQVISGKKKNYEYAKCKGLYVDQKPNSKVQKSLKSALRLIEIGKEKDVYKKVNSSIMQNRIKGKAVRLVRKLVP